MGRPLAEFDQHTFENLIGIGCGQDEITWWFRDPSGKPANIDTLSRWCVRTYGMTFQEYRRQNGAISLKIQLRNNQLALSKKSAAMAIFLGKNYLNQSDNPNNGDAVDEPMAELFRRMDADINGGNV